MLAAVAFATLLPCRTLGVSSKSFSGLLYGDIGHLAPMRSQPRPLYVVLPGVDGEITNDSAERSETKKLENELSHEEWFQGRVDDVEDIDACQAQHCESVKEIVMVKGKHYYFQLELKTVSWDAASRSWKYARHAYVPEDPNEPLGWDCPTGEEGLKPDECRETARSTLGGFLAQHDQTYHSSR
jgi:hypothetical protein